MQIVVRDYEGNPFKGPRSLCFDSGGQLFFTDGGAYGETSLHTPTGSCFVVTGEANSRILRPVALDCLAHPTGVTLNPTESAVYVTEQVELKVHCAPIPAYEQNPTLCASANPPNPQAANRVLRFVQRPTGVFHMCVLTAAAVL